ncbi:MAG: DegV family protein [Lachnospiraceae bacterium]|nr:DegV family protein [Lachnospiraceae bacterium]
MANFELFTDSSCDLAKEIIDKYDLKVMQLEVIMDENPPVLNNQVEIKAFYDSLRAGSNAKTSAVTPGFFEEHMRAALESGKDILYVGFSSGLSVTYNNGVMICEELRQEFPERKILYVDTTSGSGGQALMVYHAAKMREQGATMEEIKAEIEALRDYVHHQVTVEDLFFLKRGGRIDAKSAIVGTMLKIKPIINVDVNGKLNSVAKVRGRKSSITELVNRMKATVDIERFPYVSVFHGDCPEEADALEAMVKEAFPQLEVLRGDVGPVIGAHTGPGVLVLCYVGKVVKGTME